LLAVTIKQASSINFLFLLIIIRITGYL